MQRKVGDDFWQDATQKYPVLKDFDGLRDKPRQFIAVVKSLHEIDYMEAKGDNSLSEYKNPAKIIKIFDEMKSSETFFCESIGKIDTDNLRECDHEFYADFSACNVFMTNDNMTASKSFDMLIRNASGLPDIVKMRENMVTRLSYHLPQYIDYEMDNTQENARAVQKIIEDDPRGVLALMAVADKNAQQGFPKIKISSPEDLESKKNIEDIQFIAEKLPLTQSYAHAIDYASQKAEPMVILGQNKNLSEKFQSISKYQEGLKRA